MYYVLINGTKKNLKTKKYKNNDEQLTNQKLNGPINKKKKRFLLCNIGLNKSLVMICMSMGK